MKLKIKAVLEFVGVLGVVEKLVASQI